MTKFNATMKALRLEASVRYDLEVALVSTRFENHSEDDLWDLIDAFSWVRDSQSGKESLAAIEDTYHRIRDEVIGRWSPYGRTRETGFEDAFEDDLFDDWNYFETVLEELGNR